MILPVFQKALKEQIRNVWILLLTLSLAPFFVFVYFLINESEQLRFDVLVYSQDEQEGSQGGPNAADGFVEYCQAYISSSSGIPLRVKQVSNRETGIKKLSSSAADVLVILPDKLHDPVAGDHTAVPQIEIVGNLNSTAYLVGAVWVGEILDEYMHDLTGRSRLYNVKEIALGRSAEINEFERWMPGMLILSVIMLFFSATIAIVTEVEQKTILRIKLSSVKAWQYLMGVGAVQLLVGLLSLVLTYAAASALGFENIGSMLLFSLICFLASLSMIAFSLLMAGLTKSVSEVLVIGNFPFFLFMFFTGAAFPLDVPPWFTLSGYGISWQTLLSPTPAIQALTKVSLLGQGWGAVVPELIALCCLTGLYFFLGVVVFKHRHMRTSY